MTAPRKAKVIHLRNGLGELLNRTGGLDSARAISAAAEGVEKLRASLVQALIDEVAQAEILASSATDPVTEELMMELFRNQGVIFNLAGTFGYMGLQSVAAGLSDLLAEGCRRGSCPLDAIIVHIQAARLVSPDAVPLHETKRVALLSRLAKVRFHVESKAGGKPVQM